MNSTMDLLEYILTMGELEREKTMTRKEAWQAILSGEKVSPPNQPDAYMYYDDGRDYHHWRYVNSDGVDDVINHIMDDPDGYTIYVPPKKVVQMWQYVYIKDNENPRVSEAYFTDEAEAAAALAPCQVLQQADWTEIEIEM